MTHPKVEPAVRLPQLSRAETDERATACDISDISDISDLTLARNAVSRDHFRDHSGLGPASQCRI